MRPRGKAGGKVSEGTRFLSDETRRKDRQRAREFMRRKRSVDRTALALKAQYDELVEELGETCGICGKEPTGSRRLAIDHDHNTGLVRGLLCHRCNGAIGLLGDSAEAMEAAIKYLARHTANPGTRLWAGLPGAAGGAA